MDPRNPYRNALAAIWIASLVLAAAIWMIGTATVNSDPFAADPIPPDAVVVGAGMVAFAGSLFGLGILALLLWLVVSSLTWRAPAAPEATAPAKAAKPRAASAGPRTELDRVREALDAEDQG